ncbi:hypothetical protein GUJ93_ZPchr0011g27178 [Zizania palustris]|uniref:Jacalin-type lectin domain-containing protein n=1 Tax=Zizania palustris TaxID=103762 RepID=A0A8J5WJS6_ZIZPA|nr:hypothetical protein GUJ93_ZPchr0011g27178 [Zizania palustris]
MQNSGSIVGFFVRAALHVHAIGVYANPQRQENIEQEAGVAKMGPWGGNGGDAHDMDTTVPAPRRLESIKLRSGDIVDSLAFTYTDHNGQRRSAAQLSADLRSSSKRLRIQPKGESFSNLGAAKPSLLFPLFLL